MPEIAEPSPAAAKKQAVLEKMKRKIELRKQQAAAAAQQL
jgi:hypothetical protein